MNILIFFTCIVMLISTVAREIIKSDENDKYAFSAFSSIMIFILAIPIFFPYIGFTGGLYENYSSGYRTGYIVKCSEKGLIFKTHECEMQLGTGNFSSTSKPFEFTLKNEEIMQDINIGEKVKIEYSQWLIQPFSEGESGYIANEIKNI